MTAQPGSRQWLQSRNRQLAAHRHHTQRTAVFGDDAARRQRRIDLHALAFERLGPAPACQVAHAISASSRPSTVTNDTLPTGLAPDPAHPPVCGSTAADPRPVRSP
jgi:hypothetical protein